MKCRGQTLFHNALRFGVPLDKGNGGSGDEIAKVTTNFLHAQINRFVFSASQHAQSDGKSVNRGLPVLDLPRGRKYLVQALT